MSYFSLVSKRECSNTIRDILTKACSGSIGHKSAHPLFCGGFDQSMREGELDASRLHQPKSQYDKFKGKGD